ncbi:MAG: hypothetical protein QM695_04575 [Micropruina sp.]
MKASTTRPYTSRAEPVRMSVAVSSSSPLVISAPGTRTAIGAQIASSGTPPRSSRVAARPSSAVESRLATNGASAAAPRTRCSSTISNPTRPPITRLTRIAHHGQRNSTASPPADSTLPNAQRATG